MNHHRTHPRDAAVAALGGVALIVVAVMVLTAGPFNGEYDTAAAYVNDVALMVGLACVALATRALATRIGLPSRPVLLATIGPALLFVGVAAGVARGDDPGWFAAFGIPGNLLWLIGTVWLGVHAFRNHLLPRAAAVLVGLTVILAVAPFGEVGGSAVIGLLWLWIGATVLRAGVPVILPRTQHEGGGACVR